LVLLLLLEHDRNTSENSKNILGIVAILCFIFRTLNYELRMIRLLFIGNAEKLAKVVWENKDCKTFHRTV
jgi:hypothetical protein